MVCYERTQSIVDLSRRNCRARCPSESDVKVLCDGDNVVLYGNVHIGVRAYLLSIAQVVFRRSKFSPASCTL